MHQRPQICPNRPGGHAEWLGPGFTLVEILVALVTAGLLTAMLAAVLGQGVTVSSALGTTATDQHSRVVLYRLLSMDLRGMLPETELTIFEQGFTLETVHNHLIPGPLPVIVTWDFSGNRLRRIEEQPDLEYLLELPLISRLRDWNLDLYDLTEGRWVNLQAWIAGPEQPAPVGVRLELRLPDAVWRATHRLPLEHDVAH